MSGFNVRLTNLYITKYFCSIIDVQVSSSAIVIRQLRLALDPALNLLSL